MRYLEQISIRVNQLLFWIAGVALISMMLLAVANMVLRVVYVPFGATAEVIGWLAAITTAFSLGYTQIKRAHVTIDLLVSRFPPRIQAFIDTIIHFLSTTVFALAAWQTFLYAAHLRQLGSLSETLRVPYYPLVYLVAMGLACLAFALLIDLLKSVLGVINK
ncbi:TRAP transporter small permease [Calderihabitans maritimus]|uniref:Tripartite ATP-independent periplasmic transporter DctQ component n=1 Tax=Calderihabitans maritimus TaxID=1246530 RepID=A0A1Z5HTA0_9FIRM|nr:TRAP transporter small permease [Calderihabitans maritimus]GAW92535.1 tripartite ATP-independent periplasmic transporter DctQ component [Calderihabitans maritimus]